VDTRRSSLTRQPKRQSLGQAVCRRLDIPEAQSGLTRTAAHLHFAMKEAADGIGILLVDGFHYLALFAIGATTVWSALAAFCGMFSKGRAELSDILLLFIYLESAQWSESILRQRDFRSAI